VNPAPQRGMIPAGDPLAYLQATLASVNTASCDQTNLTVNGTSQSLFPGVYCGGLIISGGANVTLNPGLYVMTPFNGTNHGLTISGTSTVSGDGVTFFNAAGSASVSITSTGTVSLTAPTSGSYSGILVAQDPTNTSSATVDGGTNPKFEGAFYFPNLNTQLTIDDIGSSAAYTILVAGSLDIRGNNNLLGSNYFSLSNGSPIKDAVLVE
jgi:hypothetical protein